MSILEMTLQERNEQNEAIIQTKDLLKDQLDELESRQLTVIE